MEIQIQQSNWLSSDKKQEIPSGISFDVNPWEDSQKPHSQTKESDVPDRKWNAVNGVQPPKIIRDFKGLSLMDPFSIEDGYATEIENLSSKQYPSLKTRNNLVQMQSMGGSITGMGVRKDTDLVVVANGIVKRYNGSWSASLGNLSSTALCSFTNFKGSFNDYNLLIANGVDPIKRFDGMSFVNLENAPSGANFIDSHDNRVYCAVGNIIKYCALRKADDWTTVDDAGEIVLETKDGEDVSGLKAGPGHLVVFTEHSMHELFGNGPQNYKMTVVSEKIGCVSNASAVMVSGILYFLGHDGIYQYAGGAIPKKEFSLPVQGLIDNISVSDRAKCVGGTNGSKYYLAIPSSNGVFDTMLEYDPVYKTWHVWKSGHETTSFAILNEVLYEGSKNGNVYYLSDNASGVSWKWVSKPIGFGSLASKMRWYRMWSVVDLPSGSTLDIYLSPDSRGENWTNVCSLVPSDDVQSKQIMIPINAIVNSNWARVKMVGTGPCTIHEISYQERIFPMGQG